jgi:hypothetical protein
MEDPREVPLNARRDYKGLGHATAIMIDILYRLDYKTTGA